MLRGRKVDADKIDSIRMFRESPITESLLRPTASAGEQAREGPWKSSLTVSARS